MRAWNGKDFGQFDQHPIALTPMLSRIGESHLAYPILYYFHSGDRLRSLSLSLSALDEALTLMQYGIAPEARPDPVALKAARRASAAFLRTLKGIYSNSQKDVMHLRVSLVKSQRHRSVPSGVSSLGNQRHHQRPCQPTVTPCSIKYVTLQTT